MGSLNFPVQERLKSAKAIAELYKKGRSLSQSNLFVKYQLTPTTTESVSRIQIAVAVSKKLFKKAIHRNRVKRLMRECYRLNAPTLRDTVSNSGYDLRFVVTYTGSELPTFADLTHEFKLVFKRLEKSLKKVG